MAHSKSVLEAVSMALARELEPEGVAVNVVFPGRASTALTRSVACAGLPGPMKCCWPCLKLMFRDDGGKGAARASASTVWCATNRALDGVTGRYYGSNSKEQRPHPISVDPAVQARILAVIEAAAPTPNRAASSQ